MRQLAGKCPGRRRMSEGVATGEAQAEEGRSGMLGWIRQIGTASQERQVGRGVNGTKKRLAAEKPRINNVTELKHP